MEDKASSCRVTRHMIPYAAVKALTLGPRGPAKAAPGACAAVMLDERHAAQLHLTRADFRPWRPRPPIKPHGFRTYTIESQHTHTQSKARQSENMNTARIPACRPARPSAPARATARLAPPPAAPHAAPAAAAKRRIPKLPGQLPFLGVLPMVDPHKLFRHVSDAQRRQGTRMMEVELLGTRLVRARHPQDAAQILKDRKTFPKIPAGPAIARWLGSGLVTDEDEAHHDAVRAIVMPAFRAEAVRAYCGTFTEIADQLADVILESEGAALDIEPFVQRATLDVIGLTGFSYDFGAVRRASKGFAGGGPDVSAAYKDILEPAELFFLLTRVPVGWVPGAEGYMRGVELLEEVAHAMMAEHRAGRVAGGRRSLLAFMLEAQAAGGGLMTDAQIRDELMTLMLAGSDTTSSTIAFTLYEASRRPEMMARLLAEVDSVLAGREGLVAPDDVAAMPFLAACVNETLRCYSAATSLPRLAAQDVEVGGYLIPKGTRLQVDIWAMHRHEDFWPRADEYLPERWLPENAGRLAPHAGDAFMPFGAGARSCVGRYFALLEAQVLLAQLLRRVRFEAAAGRAPVAIKECFTIASDGGIYAVPRARGATAPGGPAASAACAAAGAPDAMAAALAGGAAAAAAAAHGAAAAAAAGGAAPAACPYHAFMARFGGAGGA
ncbi:MAG: cytochrome P450 [Monoraphidium minutum]|nr:MAG: cytochrome P450 [Monoraphidium minutum]